MRAMTVSKKHRRTFSHHSERELKSTQYRRTTAAPGWGSGAWTRAVQEDLVLLAPLNSTTSQEEGAKKAAKAKNHLTIDWHCQEAQISSGSEGNPKESQETGSHHGQESNQELREYESQQTKKGKDPAKGKIVKPKATKPKAEKLKVASG